MKINSSYRLHNLASKQSNQKMPPCGCQIPLLKRRDGSVNIERILFSDGMWELNGNVFDRHCTAHEARDFVRKDRDPDYLTVDHHFIVELLGLRQGIPPPSNSFVLIGLVFDAIRRKTKDGSMTKELFKSLFRLFWQILHLHHQKVFQDFCICGRTISDKTAYMIGTQPCYPMELSVYKQVLSFPTFDRLLGQDLCAIEFKETEVIFDHLSNDKKDDYSFSCEYICKCDKSVVEDPLAIKGILHEIVPPNPPPVLLPKNKSFGNLDENIPSLQKHTRLEEKEERCKRKYFELLKEHPSIKTVEELRSVVVKDIGICDSLKTDLLFYFDRAINK